MAIMTNMNLIGYGLYKRLACGGGDGGGTTKNIISPKFSNFGDIIIINNPSDVITYDVANALKLIKHKMDGSASLEHK